MWMLTGAYLSILVVFFALCEYGQTVTLRTLKALTSRFVISQFTGLRVLALHLQIKFLSSGSSV